MSQILKIPLTNTDYTAIVAPSACDYYTIMGCENGYAIRRSSDGTDEHSYVMTGSYAVVAPLLRLSGTGYARFKPGETVTYLKLVSAAADNAIVEFLI